MLRVPTGANVASDAHHIKIFLPQEVWKFAWNPDKCVDLCGIISDSVAIQQLQFHK